MTIYFVGGEIGSYTPADGDIFEDAQVYNSSFARCGIRPVGSTTFATAADFGTLPDDFWIHADLGIQPSGESAFRYPIVLKVGATEVFRIAINTSTIKVEALISAVWTQVGSSVSVDIGAGNYQTIDLSVAGNSATGSVTLYIAGTERMTATADLTSVAAVDGHTIGPVSSRAYSSQVIIADEPTIGWRLATFYPSGNGANTAWTGDYTGVDELRYSDADFTYSSTANQVETYTVTGPTLTGYVVRGVGVYCRARRGSTGPQNLQLALRVSGTDYFSGTKALGLGYDSYGHIWEDNPDTTVDWLAASVAAVQPGVKSIT